MKHLIGLCIILLMPLMSFGQEDRSMIQPTRAVQKDQIVIDAYVGYPNGWQILFKMAASSMDGYNFIPTPLGPIGARIEYLITDKIGLSADIWYAKSGLAYITSRPVNGPNGVAVNQIYSTKISRDKVGAIFCFNFHLVENPNFDLSLAGGAGYKKVTFNEESNDPNYDAQTSEGLIPVDVRISMNCRYYFNDTIGLNVSIGLGGPLMSGGISIAI